MAKWIKLASFQRCRVRLRFFQSPTSSHRGWSCGKVAHKRARLAGAIFAGWARE
jgi:hypothetical protein